MTLRCSSVVVPTVARKSASVWTAPTLARTAFESRTLTDRLERGPDRERAERLFFAEDFLAEDFLAEDFLAEDFFAADFLTEPDLAFLAVDLAMALSRAQCISLPAIRRSI